MAIAPNTTFTTQVLTSTQMNAFGFGVVALASSATTFTLATSTVIATGMTVNFTAIANRYYKITYYEPQAQSPNVSGYSVPTIRQTSAAGTQLQQGIIQNTTAATLNRPQTLIYVGTLTAGSQTIVGCGITTSTSGAPTFTRAATGVAFLLVEDIGPA